MVFNPAMNSIPILLLAIGVDYGLHVVARIREDMQEQEKKHPQQRLNLRDFSQEAKSPLHSSTTSIFSFFQGSLEGFFSDKNKIFLLLYFNPFFVFLITNGKFP